MKHARNKVTTAGFTLVEAIVVSAIAVVVFGALLASFKYALDLISLTKAKQSAQSLANDRMEYFRSLPYDDVGTLLGIPSGTIPQNSVLELNNINFHERVLVEYVDDDADGEGALDTNGIVADYKRVKLEYTWNLRGASSSIALISNIVPRSVETTAGGGTVRINVIDDQSNLLPGATVRLFNNTIATPVDVTKITDATGAALFSGAPTGSDYAVEVSGTISGHLYSETGTYEATTSNPNPIVAPFSVLEADVSTLTFQIGELSDLDIFTRSAVSEQMFQEEFTDLLAVASSSDVETVSGSLVLEQVAGSYKNSGVVYLGPVTPAQLKEWQTVLIAGSVPANTVYRTQFFTGTAPGPFVLIPDGDLSGNASGFTDSIIDVSVLDPLAYPAIIIGITLETTDTDVTPEIDEARLFYRENETALPDAHFTIHGAKIIGTDVSAQPIYKYDTTLSTDGAGELEIVNLEFDNYTLAFTGYDIAMACPTHPFVQQAGVDGELELLLASDALNTLRVVVVDGSDRPIPGADVRLTRTGYDVTIVTNSCGQAFFTGGVTANNDYTIDVSAVGYTPESVSPFEIAEDTVTSVTLN